MKPTQLTVWLRLFRAPNLFTVPGDPIAGFLLAQFASGTYTPLSSLTAAACSAILLYMAGLALNDWADRAEDARERPERPIPSGRLNASTVLTAAIFLSAAAMLLTFIFCGTASALTATLLLLMIVLYNLFAKHIRILGPLVMGSCRGLSLILGATAAGWRPASPDIIASTSLALTLYIAALTSIAADETASGPVGLKRWLPALVTFLILIGIPWSGSPAVLFLCLMSLLFIWCTWQGAKLTAVDSPAKVKSAVKAFILGLFLFQAAVCTLSGQPGLIAAGSILLTLPLSITLARRFYVT